MVLSCVGAVLKFPSSGDFFSLSPPCPPDEVLYPCWCDNAKIAINCSYVKDEVELQRVFARQPENEYKIFSAYKNTLKHLPKNVFGETRFLNFELVINNFLESVHEEAFAGSEDAATTVIIKGSKLNSTALYAIQRLAKLRHLEISFSILSHLPISVLRDIKHLTYLDLSNNFIGAIKPETFRGLSKLREVKLMNNKITKLEDFSFAFEGPAFVNLSGNRITSLSALSFGEIRNTTHVDLSRNSLKTLRREEFEPLLTSFSKYPLSRINIQGNLLSCDGSLAWLKQHPHRYILSDASCEDGRSLSEFLDS